MFLLGAGASMDAGLPGSMGLTRAVVEHLESRGPHQLAGLLNAVVGAMIAHDTANGASAFAGVDVERVFAAVKMLKDRDSLDLSAFVETWNRSIDSFAMSHLGGSFGRDFRRALTGERASDFDVERMFTRGIEALTSTDPSRLLHMLEAQMLTAMVGLLHVEDDRVSYLEPMIRARPLAGVATLNYDLAVERATAQFNVSLDTGFDRWDGGYDWEWGAAADVRLLKLHGSLDYVLGSTHVDGQRVVGDNLARISGNPETQSRTPAMVFGHGSKLRSDGPFLAMLVELDRLLSQTEWLTIVGYSFRDDHINAAITRWINGPTATRLSVVDPAVETLDHQGNYFRRLAAGVRGRPRAGGRAGWPPLEHEFLPTTASDGLASLHG